MKQADVKLGGIYETKIGGYLAWVEVVSVAPFEVGYPGGTSTHRTKFMIRRVFDDGTKGPILSKRRSAAALRPRTEQECATCLGVGKLRDGDTNDLRKCLDCRGEGVS